MKDGGHPPLAEAPLWPTGERAPGPTGSGPAWTGLHRAARDPAWCQILFREANKGGRSPLRYFFFPFAIASLPN
jgi:hypothetical protein